MAALLDTSLLNHLLPIFSFLFVMAIVFAVMDKFKLVGGNKLIHLTVAFSIAFIFLFSSDAVRFLNILTPWFILMVVFGLFLVSFFIFLGVSQETITGALIDPKVYWFVIGISGLMFFISLGVVYSDTVGPGSSSDSEGVDQIRDTVTNIGEDGSSTRAGINAIVHPKVLGALFLLIIGALAIRLISEGYNN